MITIKCIIVSASSGHFEKQIVQNREWLVLKPTKHVFPELKVKQEALIGDWKLEKTQ
jgi:hypothetical protein